MEEKLLIKRHCAFCGRGIWISPAFWQFRDHKKVWCSYSCMNKSERQQADKDRRKIKYANHSYAGADLRNRLMIEVGEAHTLEEWAEMYGLDYYTLWRQMQQQHSIVDAIDAALERKTQE